MEVPEHLRGLADSAEGRAWIDALPGFVEAAVDRWSLQLGTPYPDGNCSLVIPATRPDGTTVVLKLGLPHHESRHEGDALARWNGNGAIRLIDQDQRTGALLLERCLPGTPLADAGADEAIEILTGLLPRLWVPASEPFRALSDEAAWWASYLPRRWREAGEPFDAELLHAAMTALEDLPGSQGPSVLLNQDLHAGNVLRAQREPWLVIDPKPLAGEKEFGIAAIVRGRELGHSREAVLGRLDRLCSSLDLDRERARRWALAQTIAWAFDGSRTLPGHVEVATWLHEARPKGT